MEPLILLGTVLLLILSIAWIKVHPFVALLGYGFLFGVMSGLPLAESLDLLMEGFGKTLQWIALIMIFGTFIGEVARETGGALRIANAVLRAFGAKRLPVAMGATGYILSIPVFVDVAYIMMRSITETLSQQSGRGILVVGLSLVAGLTATHALMPPTPGPIAIVAILNADLGRVIFINGFVAAFAMGGGVLWAAKVGKRFDSQLEAQESPAQRKNSGLETEKTGIRSVWLALVPILVPLVLIALASFLPVRDVGWLVSCIHFLGVPQVALFIGALISLVQFGKQFSMVQTGKLVEASIEKSALVIMITAAGGAFGHVIRGSGMVETLAESTGAMGEFGFLLPFVIAAVFTTATGSITVSMITTASLVAPLIGQLNISPEMVVALIGCGAFCVFHVNSSFFWLLNRLHNIPPAVLLKSYTTQSLAMGLSGLFAVLLLKFLVGVG